MFGPFRRKSGGGRHVDGEQGLRRIAEGRLQMEALGRLPGDVAAGGSPPEPTPEYIEQAATPSEDVWEREQARYHAKNEEQPGT